MPCVIGYVYTFYLQILYVRSLLLLYVACCINSISDSDSLMKTRVSLLAEARHTAYIKGRWIKGLSEWEEMYRIVKAVLPGNGDYALYCTSFWDTSGNLIQTFI